MLGHPRSGTAFMSKLLGLYGFDVGHERMGKDGISSWMFGVKENQIFTDFSLNRKDFGFEHIIMAIRHPLHIISSTYYTENANVQSLSFRKRYVNMVGLNEIETAVQSVLGWYECIEVQAPAVTIYVDKDPKRDLQRFLTTIEKRPLQIPSEPIGAINARNHPTLLIDFIARNCQLGLLRKLEEFCKIHHYSL